MSLNHDPLPNENTGAFMDSAKVQDTKVNPFASELKIPTTKTEPFTDESKILEMKTQLQEQRKRENSDQSLSALLKKETDADIQSKTPHEELVVYFNQEPMLIYDARVLIHHQINQHTTGNIRAKIKADIYDAYVQKASESTLVQVEFYRDEVRQYRYCGLLKRIAIETKGVEENGVYWVTFIGSLWT